MKPLSKVEADVLALSAQLPEIDESRFYPIYGDLYDVASDDIGYNCYAMNCKRMVYLNQCYVLVFQSFNGYQVVRRFLCETRIRIPMGYMGERTCEIAQLWITPEGELVQLCKPKARTRLVCGWRHDYWATGAEMRASLKADLEMFSNLDEVTMDGNETIFIDSLSSTLVDNISKIPFEDRILAALEKSIEWLKCMPIRFSDKVYDLLAKSDLRLSGLYPSLRIAHRHKYDLDGNIDKWIHLVCTMMQVKGADMHQPKYICPTDIDATIEFFEKKLRKQKQKEKEEMLKKMAKENQAANERYKQKMQQYICIAFDTETLHFHVLKDVCEFFEEASAMHHCVYANRYFEKYSSLILSCTDKRTGKRVSTIEFDLRTMRVIQNYAACNKVPSNDEEIRKAVGDNLNLMRLAA